MSTVRLGLSSQSCHDPFGGMSFKQGVTCSPVNEMILADQLKPFSDQLNAMVWTKLMPVLILVAIASIAYKLFEYWLIDTIQKWRKTSKSKARIAPAEADNANDFQRPHCPLCNGLMTLRTARKDSSKFWGCGKFPKCRGTRSV